MFDSLINGQQPREQKCSTYYFSTTIEYAAAILEICLFKVLIYETFAIYGQFSCGKNKNIEL